jgi:Protein kinase domain
MIHQESVGDEFAGYRIEGVIRHGGMATVYHARHLVLHRPAALKVLAPGLARDQRFRARFLGESRAAASLDHPHIVPIYDAGEAQGVLYIAMRLIEGADLRTLLEAERRLEPHRAVALLGQVASALDAAHSRGLVHRDVKPSNILVAAATTPDAAEHAYLADFGITKQLASEGLTATSEFLGTIDYMSPEQIEGLTLDGRADVYALGCVLHQCLTGVAPFAADTVVGVMHAHLTKPPPRPSAVDSSLPGGLDSVVAGALAKSPADRPSTCTALTDAARAALASPRRRPAPPPFVPRLTPVPSPAAPPSASGPGPVAAPAAAAAAAAARPAIPPAAVAAAPRRTPPRGVVPGGIRRWRAVLAGAAALVLLAVVAAASLRGIPGPPTTGGTSTSQAGGVLPLPTASLPPVTGATPEPSATPGPTSAAPSPSRGLVVVPVTPAPAAPRATAPHAPGPTAAPHTPGPTSTPACEKNWSWSCVPPGTCHTVDMNQPVDLTAATPGTADGGRDFPVVVGQQGVLCAHWDNSRVRGELLDDHGNVVPNTDGPSAVGFIAFQLGAGRTYRVRLWRVDASTPSPTTLQINT